MNRSQYIREIKSRLSNLSVDEVEEALSFYEEILDDRGVSVDDEVPADMPSPRKAAYEILRDVNISNLETEVDMKSKNKPSVFKTLILSILAAPLALPFGFALIALVFALAFSLGVTYLAFTFAGFVAIGLSFYEIFTVLPSNFELARLFYLIGAIFISIALIIFLYLAAKFITDSIKNLIVNRQKKERRA